MAEITPHKTLQPIDSLIVHLLSNTPYDKVGAVKLWEALKNLDSLRHKHAIKAEQIAVAELNIPEDIGLKLLIPPGGLVAPPVDGWSWVNQGTASVSSDSNGRITLRGPTIASVNLRIRDRPAPSTPYIITAAFYVYTPDLDASVGLIFRDSVGGRLLTNAHDTYGTFGGSVNSSRWNSPTSHNSAQGTGTSAPMSLLNWFQIEDDGTTLFIRSSPDGVNWITIHSELQTAFLANAPNRVGFFANVLNILEDNVLTLVHWKVA